MTGQLFVGLSDGKFNGNPWSMWTERHDQAEMPSTPTLLCVSVLFAESTRILYNYDGRLSHRVDFSSLSIDIWAPSCPVSPVRRQQADTRLLLCRYELGTLLVLSESTFPRLFVLLDADHRCVSIFEWERHRGLKYWFDSHWPRDCRPETCFS